MSHSKQELRLTSQIPGILAKQELFLQSSDRSYKRTSESYHNECSWKDPTEEPAVIQNFQIRTVDYVDRLNPMADIKSPDKSLLSPHFAS